MIKEKDMVVLKADPGAPANVVIAVFGTRAWLFPHFNTVWVDELLIVPSAPKE